jgi:hypothetical protein
MANELSISTSLRYTKSNVSLPQRSLSGTFTVAGIPVLHLAASIGTSEETLEKGELTLTGYALFYNSDATNYIEIGDTTGTYQLKLLAGEFALLRLNSWANIFAKANTAAVTLEYTLISA